MTEGDRYTHGHSESVLRSHRWRTAENSAAYLLDQLRAGHRLLDVGCGPGTITLDLAQRVSPGLVLGIDNAETIIEEAERSREEAQMNNVRFAVDDVYQISETNDSFDVVHAHQVLQHLTNPVRALKEMRRVLKPGGILAVRDSDYGAFTWSPADHRLDRWLELYHQITTKNRAQADAGRHLLGWVHAAGFPDATASSSTWTFADDEGRAWWGELWADRVRTSAFATQALDYGFSDPGELEDIAAAWLDWSRHPDGAYIVVHGEVIARNS